MRAKVDPADLPTPTAAALAILQACPDGLPLEVMARAIPHSQEALVEQLVPLTKEDVLTVHGGVWSVRPLPTTVDLEGRPDLLARVLGALLEYIRTHKNDNAGQGQVRNATAATGRIRHGQPSGGCPKRLSDP